MIMLNLKVPNTKYLGILGHCVKTKPKNNKNRRRRRCPPQRFRKYFQQYHRKKFFPKLKKEKPVKVKEAYRIPNRFGGEKKIPSAT